MRVLFTCGGTAGHVNPAVALAQMFQTRNSGCEVLFVGADGGMETRLVPKEGYPIETVTITNFRRSLSPASIGHNVRTLLNMNKSRKQANAILDRFQPDLVVGTGGYASFPVVKAAAKRGIPTAVHESNAVPGLTTKTLSKVVDVVMVGFEESRSHYDDPGKVVVTGTPVREDFFALTREQAKARLGVDDGRPLIVSFWGSLGAAGMNRQMVDFLALEAAKEPFHHIHAAGGGNREVLAGSLRERGVDLEAHPSLDLREYIYDMAVVLRAADLVICRAGASTISELTALGVPALMVPSPYVTNNHQEKNARALEAAGGAVVLVEGESTGQKLFQTACGILHDESRRRSMENAMAALGIRDAGERILETVGQLLRV